MKSSVSDVAQTTAEHTRAAAQDVGDHARESRHQLARWKGPGTARRAL